MATHVNDSHDDPPDLVSPNHCSVDVLVLVVVIALFLLKDSNVGCKSAVQAFLVNVASFFEVGARPIERVVPGGEC